MFQPSDDVRNKYVDISSSKLKSHFGNNFSLINAQSAALRQKAKLL